MSAFKESPVDGSVHDADVVMNRLNVALARSQRLINSWLPQNQPAEADGGKVEVDDDDGDFKPMSEAGGIGSKVAFDDEGLPDGAWQRKKLSSNDKLMEQLMGKKAARAKMKSQGAGKNMSTSRHAAPKPLANGVKEQKRKMESDDEEEVGRAAAFKSRRSRKALHNNGTRQVVDEGANDDMGANERGLTSAVVSGLQPDTESGSAMDMELDEKTSTRKRGSYLDELLAQKAKKKKTKQKKRPPADS